MSVAFNEYSKIVVENFINNILFIDDMAFQYSEVKAQKVQNNSGITNSLIKSVKHGNINEVEKSMETSQKVHQLDVVGLTRTFSELGILTSFFDKLLLKEKERKLVHKADIVVLDWNFAEILNNAEKESNDNSQILDFIKEVLDETKEPKLKLIVIYTAEKDLDEIINSLGKHLNIDPLDNKIIKDKTKIIIYDKTKQPNEFRDKCIEEFSLLVSGLVSNFALKAITEIRDNTSVLLGIYRAELDPAFLSHRALLPNPEDASELLKSVFSESLKSFFDYSTINSATDIEQIESYLNSCKNFRKDSLETIKNDNSTSISLPITNENRVDWQKGGLEWFENNDNGLSAKNKKIIKKDLHKILTPVYTSTRFGNSDKFDADAEFAIISHQKSILTISETTPVLSLGSIIKSSEGKFFLCIQQKCDCIIRNSTDTNRAFLFLPLIEDDSNFSIICKWNNKMYKLKPCSKSYEIKIIPFEKTDELGLVIATKLKENEYYFESTDQSRYMWVCDLKELHAQRLVNVYSSNLTRVGLDESEWLRRYGTI